MKLAAAKAGVMMSDAELDITKSTNWKGRWTVRQSGDDSEMPRMVYS